MKKGFWLLLLTAITTFEFGTANSVSAATNKPQAPKTQVVANKTEKNRANLSSKSSKTLEGWVTENGATSYYQDGKKVTGQIKIGNSYYLFDKNGQRLSGVRKTPHKASYSYYLDDGKRSETSIATPKTQYLIKNGKIIGVKNKAAAISQRPQLPTGCEMTAVTMMLNFAGIPVSKTEVANLTPRSSNPNKGFIGSPYKKYPAGYWVAPNGIKGVVKKYLGTAKVMTGASLTAIKNKLLRSHLVVVWVSGIDGFSNHALTLTGYYKKRLYYNDPWTGKKASINTSNFIKHWRGDGYRALSY